MENEMPVTQTEEKTEETVVQTEQKTEQAAPVKTFTQDEVNAILKKERLKAPSKEELDEFNSWKESKKTEADKKKEVEEENIKLKEEVEFYKRSETVAKEGVDPKFVKFVISEVSSLEGDFEENLKTYLKDNEQYLKMEKNAENEPTVGKTTGVAVKRMNENADDGVTAILKAKHPDLFK